MEIRISDIDLDKTLIKAQKIAKRSQVKGLEGGYQVSIETRQEENDYGFLVEYPVLVVTGEAFKFNGWKFIGIADFIEGKAITRSLPQGRELNPSEVKVGYCEHCKTVRTRKTALFVENEQGEVKQVGSTCVKDFLGWDFSVGVFPLESEFESLGSHFGGVTGVSIGDLIIQAVAVVEKYGYIKSNQALSTKQVTWALITGNGIAQPFLEEIRKEVGQITLSQIRKADELLEFGKAFEGESEYAQNLRTVCSLSIVTEKVAGIVVSLVKVYDNQKAKEIVESLVFKSEQFAPTGDKVEIDIEVIGQNTFESQYGWTTLYTFSNGEYQFKWFSSRGLNVEIGDKFTIKGTIKGSEEYKGTFSTLLTRCKVLQIAEKIA